MPGAATGGPDPNAYDAQAQAKELLRSVRAGALATLVPGNAFPFASLVNVATAPDGSPILLLSRLAAHTRHLASDPRLSLLLVQTGAGDPLAHPRVTIMGTGECVTDPDRRAALKTRFLAKHPQSALYADFGDFSFWRVAMEQAHLNGGFARTGHFKAASLVTSLDGAEALVAAEAHALAEINAQHQDVLAWFAAALAGKPDGPWQATGIDPEGIDLGCGDRTARLAFPRPVRTHQDLFETFPSLVEAARRAAIGPA
ncbi:MAG: pyridoxamine 5'-phosphate oxidase family protein [Pseudomonadota bacterium]|nr:pyridoxamine 5'-phosphate oxidase family protein [Pseudomonadota bacterium]